MQFRLNRNGMASWLLLATTSAVACWFSSQHQLFSWFYPLPAIVAVLLLAGQRSQVLPQDQRFWQICWYLSLICLLFTLAAVLSYLLQ